MKENTFLNIFEIELFADIGKELLQEIQDLALSEYS